MNLPTHFPSMFLHRLKLEFAENLKLLLAIWAVLGIIVWSFCKWWFSPAVEMENFQGAVGGIGVLVLGLLVFFLITTLFKRDDLRHPQDFWVTRPIRSFTLFGAKLAFAWLVIALPCAVLMGLLGLLAGVGFSAVWDGLEIMLWAGFATNLLALSCMAHPGNRALFGCLCLLGGVIIACIAINNGPLERVLDSRGVGDAQMGWNFLIMLIALNILFGWKCWQHMRDKHRNQSLPAMVALGAIIVPVIAFVPIPGGLPGFASETPSTLPAITQILSPSINSNIGEKYGAKFASFSIELESGDSIRGDDWEIADTDLVAAGQDNAMLGLEASMKRYVDERGRALKSNLILDFSVFDRLPGSSGRYSSGSDSRMSGITAGIPLRKLRIQGTVTMNRIEYRELARGPLDQPFAHREGGIVCAFDPKPSRDDYNTSWKVYSPPSLLSGGSRRWESVRFRLEDPSRSGFSWTNQLGGNGMGGGALFGNYQLKGVRIQDAELEADYRWRQLKESGYGKSVQQWKKDARLIFEEMDRVVPHVIPVDIEIEVPDPEKVRELLLNGTL
jgi:hypothetical protein